MIRNYWKLIIRSLLKNKSAATINLLGLSLGISTCLVIYLLIQYETHFDQFHSKADRIYRIVSESVNDSGSEFTSSVPYPLNAAVINDYPELEAVTQVFEPQEYDMSIGEDRWTQKEVIFADSSFFKAFDFQLIAGNPEDALRHPNHILITETMSKNHFGDSSPMGKTIRISNVGDVEVAGVVADPPRNTHLPFSAIISMSSFTKELAGGFDYDSWGATLGFFSYVVLPEGMQPADFDVRLAPLNVKYQPKADAQSRTFHIQPLKDIHLNPTYAKSNPDYTVDVRYLWILGFTAFFIISMACVNFINLSTALAIRKSKEVGVRKVLGAVRSQLITHYLGEAFLLTLISLLVALGITERVLPVLNHFLDVNVSLNILSNVNVMLFLGATLLLVALASGMYPAWVLSGFKPVAALKNKATSHHSSSALLRKGLVTFQFMISQVLIIGTLVVASQMNYFRSKPLGFDKDAIVTFGLEDNNPKKLETLKNKLLSNSGIQHVSFGVGVPTSKNDINTDFTPEGSEANYATSLKTVDFDYMKTFDLQLVAGNWFTGEGENHVGDEFIVNEALVRTLGISNPEEALGKKIKIGLGGLSSPITGVLKDFHMKSLHEPIQPLVMLQFPDLFFEAGVKISHENMPGSLKAIRQAWDEVYPGTLFTYHFFDEQLENNYSREQKIYTLFEIFTGMSIFIGCLGLVGLISFMVVQKTKEVGVRKVLGASMMGIVGLFSKDFVRLIGIAFLIASPLAWVIMSQWLDSFAYKIDLKPQYFMLGGALNLLIAFLTIGYQSVKAAVVNPVESLRDE